MAMAKTWEQLIGEEDASARYRRKQPRPRLSLFDTHPSPEARMADLKASAAEVTVPGRSYDDCRGALSAGDRRRSGRRCSTTRSSSTIPGASQYIIETLARDGWNGLLRFYEAEVWRLRNRAGDDVRAAQGYAAAVALSRCAGGRVALARHHADEAGQPAEARAALVALPGDEAQRPGRRRSSAR